MRCGFRVGHWIVHPELGELECVDRKIVLKPRLMELLVYLAENAGQVLSKEHLLDTLWKDTFVAENTLMNAVSELRKALGDDRKDPTFITTHSKRGYRLIAPVSSLSEPAAPGLEPGTPVRLAVLPFLGRRADGMDPTAASLTDLLVTAAAASSVLRVVSQMSTQHCRQRLVTMPELGHALNVQRVLEGEVHRSDERVLVTVRLYDAEDEALWGEVFELGPAPSALESLARRILRRLEEEWDGDGFKSAAPRDHLLAVDDNLQSRLAS